MAKMLCGHEHGPDQDAGRVENLLPENRLIIKTAAFFKAFADNTRLKILSALSKGELCVCTLTELLCMSQSAVSHQLIYLKQAGLVKFRREGKTVLYSLDDAHIDEIIRVGFEHVEHVGFKEEEGGGDA